MRRVSLMRERSFLKLQPMVTVAPAKAERQDDAAKAR